MSTQITVDGQSVALASVGSNDGLGYGRFDAPGLAIHQYVVTIPMDSFVATMAAAYAEVCFELKADDTQTGQPPDDAFAKLGYPSLELLTEHPSALEALVHDYLHRDVFAVFVPWYDSVRYIINSTDKVEAQASALVISGRCFRRTG